MDHSHDYQRALNISRINKHKNIRNEKYFKAGKKNQVILPPIGTNKKTGEKDPSAAVQNALDIYNTIVSSYNLRISDMCDILKCDRQFITRYFRDNVEHIFLNILIRDFINKICSKMELEEVEPLFSAEFWDSTFSYDPTGQVPKKNTYATLNDYYYFSVEKANEFFQENILIEKQSIVIDFSGYVETVPLMKLEDRRYEKVSKLNKFDSDYAKQMQAIDTWFWDEFYNLLSPTLQRLFKASRGDRYKRSGEFIDVRNKVKMCDLQTLRSNKQTIKQEIIDHMDQMDLLNATMPDLYDIIMNLNKIYEMKSIYECELLTFEDIMKLYDIKSRETAYRLVYSKGLVKITLFGKIYFFKPEDAEFNLNDKVQKERYSFVYDYEKYLDVMKGEI